MSALGRLHTAMAEAMQEIKTRLEAESWDLPLVHLMTSFTLINGKIAGTYTLRLGYGEDHKVEVAYPGDMLNHLIERRAWVEQQQELAAPMLALEVSPPPKADDPEL